MPIQTERGPADGPAKSGELSSVESFLKKAVKRFGRVEQAEAHNRQQAIEDLKFKAGDQWPSAIKATRTIEKRPCLTINKMKTFVHQITNDQRQNRPAINVSPVGDKSDPETAKMLKGLIRQIERTSSAEIAYDTGFESAVSIGWGYWRVRTDFEDDDTFDQVIKIDRILNPFRVYLDPDHELPDGSDAKWAFISDLIERSEFEAQWPDADALAWAEGGPGDEYKSWSTATHVRIAEYFCIEYKKRNLISLTNGHIGFEDDLDEDIAASIKSDPDLIRDEREVQEAKIKWYKITAKDILEENEFPGKWIPIVKVIGDEVNVEGKTLLAGIIRDAKDAQRMYNFWVTSETELIALAPKAPWVMEEGQIEGHEKQWQEANNKSFPYLLYKPSSVSGKPSPPPQRQQFAGPPAGVVQAKISAAQDMQATTGIRFDATLQERTYDESGKALRELKRVGDLGNFHYVDNLSRSLRHTGRILVDLFPKIYDTPRVLTIIREDGGEERVKIDPSLGQPYAQQKAPDGRMERLYNPKLGDYDIAVTIGPSYATKRSEAADSMLAFMQAVPQSGPLIGDLIAKNMDWPGAEEIGSRMASMLPPHLLDKKLDQLPPEAKALVGSLMQQMQQLKQEHDKSVALLGDKEADRQIQRDGLALEKEKIGHDFEAKMTKVAADMQAKLMACIPQPGEPQEDRHIEHEIAFAKISKDFEAKMMKIMADLESARLKDEHEAEMVLLNHESSMEINQKLIKRLDEMDARMKDMRDIEIHFDRDQRTNRITKARRVNKRTMQ